MTEGQNSEWIVRVRHMLGAGFGVEDIAIRLGCSADSVRLEIKIYRTQGTLIDVLGIKKRTPQ